MRMTVIIAALAPLALAAPATAQPAATGAIGDWGNPKGTIVVRTAPCGGALCGTIIWAADKAIADARAAGVDKLVGTQLLRNYRPNGKNSWAGRVYVPDMKRTFSSRIRQTAPDRLTIAGCLIGGFICKSQEWHRMP